MVRVMVVVVISIICHINKCSGDSSGSSNISIINISSSSNSSEKLVAESRLRHKAVFQVGASVEVLSSDKDAKWLPALIKKVCYVDSNNRQIVPTLPTKLLEA